MNEIRCEMEWLDVELITERDIRRAVQASRRADGDLWIAGYFAARVLGMYQESAIYDIAQQAGKSITSVQNWAHAYQLYSELRGLTGNCQPVRALRKLLTPSHFWTAWELRNKYGYDNRKVMRYFAQILAYRENGLAHGSDALRQEVEAGEAKGGGGGTWDYYMPRLSKMITNILVTEGVPKRVNALLTELRALLEAGQ